MDIRLQTILRRANERGIEVPVKEMEELGFLNKDERVVGVPFDEALFEMVGNEYTTNDIYAMFGMYMTSFMKEAEEWNFKVSYVRQEKDAFGNFTRYYTLEYMGE